MSLYKECVDTLLAKGIGESNIFEKAEVESDIRCSNNELERMGIIAIAHCFLTEFDLEDPSFELVTNNTSGEREGRFDCHEGYTIDDTDFYVGAFVIAGSVSYAEIWSKDNDCIVAYVRM